MPDFLPPQPLATFAGWVDGQQAQAVAYLIDDSRVLEDQLGPDDSN